jgi:hypothetical protein
MFDVPRPAPSDRLRLWGIKVEQIVAKIKGTDHYSFQTTTVDGAIRTGFERAVQTI